MTPGFYCILQYKEEDVYRSRTIAKILVHRKRTISPFLVYGETLERRCQQKRAKTIKIGWDITKIKEEKFQVVLDKKTIMKSAIIPYFLLPLVFFINVKNVAFQNLACAWAYSCKPNKCNFKGNRQNLKLITFKR